MAVLVSPSVGELGGRGRGSAGGVVVKVAMVTVFLICLNFNFKGVFLLRPGATTAQQRS